jgi:hypothetical protein
LDEEKSRDQLVQRDMKPGIVYRIDDSEREFIEQALAYEGKEPTLENIQAKAKEWTRAGIDQGMQKVFARYVYEHSKEGDK